MVWFHRSTASGNAVRAVVASDDYSGGDARGQHAYGETVRHSARKIGYFFEAQLLFKCCLSALYANKGMTLRIYRLMFRVAKVHIVIIV